MSWLEDAQDHQVGGAHARVKDQTEARKRNIELLRSKGGMAEADDPERVAERIDRLSHFYPDVRPIDPAKIRAKDAEAIDHAGKLLERIINTDDLLAVRYLDGGALKERSVGRVDICDQDGRLVGYGTGSLVSPRLLLTNHHVLTDAGVAAASSIEFDYQDGVDGQALVPKAFGFDPASFFLTDEELDFSLVAVDAKPGDLAAFGFNRLIASEGKAIVGDFVSIIQHPGGERKQVALRENRVVDVLELFLHYETDTEPGSSGSPVFNDQWELVALHHASVSAPDHTELGRTVNEGIRVSRLFAALQQHPFSAAERPFVNELLGIEEAPTVTVPASPVSPVVPQVPQAASPRGISVTVPLEITLGEGRATPSTMQEGITIDPDYTDRAGYDPAFLGAGSLVVPLPTLSDALLPLAAVSSQIPAEPRYVLPYHHFSLAINQERRLAFFTAVNIDGASGFRLQRESDRWSFDPRLTEEQQTGEEVYADNPLDRGHLVRRLDPAWGTSAAEAKVCNDDTFHFTNCTPQHKDFNENKTTWAGLEDYILNNADNLTFRVNVFSGPVLAADDDTYRGVQLPRQFWKVVTMAKETGELSATAYLLSQEQLISGLEEVDLEGFSYGEYGTFQVPVTKVEELTGLSFGALADADPLSQLEAKEGPRSIDKLEQIQL